MNTFSVDPITVRPTIDAIDISHQPGALQAIATTPYVGISVQIL